MRQIVFVAKDLSFPDDVVTRKNDAARVLEKNRRQLNWK